MKKTKINICLLLLSLFLVLTCSCENTTISESSDSTNNSEYSNNTLSSENISKEDSSSSNQSTESSISNVDSDGKYADVGELKLRIFKIGKSDAYLFRTSSKTILIDCGDVDDSQEILDYFSEKALTRIDYMIITHLDKKSIGGASTLVSSLDVGAVYEPDYSKTSVEYLDFTSSLSNKNINSTKVTSDISLDIDDINIKIYPCEKSYYSDDNNFSSMISITHGNNSFLFVGDAKSERIKEIVSKSDIAHDFLMIPDNGIYDRELESLINAVSPEAVAITCSSKNPASAEVLSLLSKKGINTYQTVNGSIKITSNGSKIIYEQ